MVITDLDGTLLRSDRTFSEDDLDALEALGRKGVVRVIATGRSLFSARMVLSQTFPIDYLIFSTGAGIFDWQRESLIRRNALLGSEVNVAAEVLERMDLPFMVHGRVPDSHRFVYRRARSGLPRGDFELRVARYAQYASEWLPGQAPPRDAAQIVAIADEADADAFERLRTALPTLEVVRATSPLDGHSRWLEVFPAGVSKSHAAAWLSRRCGAKAQAAVAIGNDYNDEDMLDWAGTAFVVGNAPAELLSRHSNVPSNDECGFSVAVAKWLVDC